MDILGVGGMELVALLIIMLVVGGPKRMAQWAFTLGKYVAKLRDMWKTVAADLQREFDEAGIDVKVPEQLPNRGTFKQSMNHQLNRAMRPVTQPLKDTLKDAHLDLKPIEPAKSHPTPAASEPALDDFGVWSQS